MSANNLWNNFHLINSFIEDDNRTVTTVLGIPFVSQGVALEQVNNQKKVYSVSNIPFCIEDYNLVKDNSQIFDSDGVTKGEIVSLKWNVFSQTADITFKVKEKYTNNLKLTKILSDGQ